MDKMERDLIAAESIDAPFFYDFQNGDEVTIERMAFDGRKVRNLHPNLTKARGRVVEVNNVARIHLVEVYMSKGKGGNFNMLVAETFLDHIF